MKAMIWARYGAPDGLQLREIPTPQPAENEVRIRMRATTVVKGDCEMRSLALPLALSLPVRLMNGWKAPKRFVLLGQEFSGIVDAAGSRVSRFRKGDPVFGATGFGHGTYAQYICLPADSADDVIALKPDTLTFEQAAAIPVGALEAQHFLRRGAVQPEESVLIVGAGGSIGTAAVQMARALGARVTAVDSGEKLGMLQQIGAERVIDYTKENFADMGEKFDVILDVVGKTPYRKCIAALNRGGRYLLANPTFFKMFRSIGTRIWTSKRTVTGTAGRSAADLGAIIELTQAGKLNPVIDKTFALEQMAEAHSYVDTGRKQGNVVVRFGE